MKNLTHKSAWYSPRGFANEGTYIYGTAKEIDDFFESSVSGDANCEWSCTMNHRSEETAANRCEKQASSDIYSYKCCSEMSDIGVSSVADMVSDYENY